MADRSEHLRTYILCCLAVRLHLSIFPESWLVLLTFFPYIGTGLYHGSELYRSGAEALSLTLPLPSGPLKL